MESLSLDSINSSNEVTRIVIVVYNPKIKVATFQSPNHCDLPSENQAAPTPNQHQAAGSQSPRGSGHAVSEEACDRIPLTRWLLAK
jgi:hypothetical protein